MGVEWNNHVFYDETSPSFLRRANPVFCLNGCRQLCAKGDVAGSLGSQGYYVVSIEDQTFYAHRIIWEMLNRAEIPDKCVVDHKDRDRLNNHHLNLRIVDRASNSQNMSKRKDNMSGVTGVSLTNNGKNTYWTASYTSDGRNMKKHFSILKFGKDEAFSMAVKFRQQMLDTLNEEGHCYTKNHGL